MCVCMCVGVCVCVFDIKIIDRKRFLSSKYQIPDMFE